MNTRKLLYRRILEDPADDVLRLAYADALDDAGGAENAARADFIRRAISDADDRECFTHPGGYDIGCDPYDGLVPAEWHVPGGNFHGFFLGWRREDGPTPAHISDLIHVTFRRGFVSEVSLAFTAYENHAETLFRRWPIEKVILTNYRQLHSVGGVWYRNGPFGGYEDVINAEIFDALVEGEWGNPDRSIRMYPDYAAAFAALSDAAVAVGRKKAKVTK